MIVLELCLMCDEQVYLVYYYAIIGFIILGILINFLMIGLAGGKEPNKLNSILKYISIFKI